MTTRSDFEKAFGPAYRQMKQLQSDQGQLDVTELMWIVWQNAKFSTEDLVERLRKKAKDTNDREAASLLNDTAAVVEMYRQLASEEHLITPDTKPKTEAFLEPVIETPKESI